MSHRWLPLNVTKMSQNLLSLNNAIFILNVEHFSAVVSATFHGNATFDGATMNIILSIIDTENIIGGDFVGDGHDFDESKKETDNVKVLLQLMIILTISELDFVL